MTDHFCEGLEGGHRSSKPREVGLTMVANFGLGLAAVRDLLDVAADHFEFLKIAVGLSRLYPKAILSDIIDLCHKRQVAAFPGGGYLEYAEVHGRADRYFPAMVEIGYQWIEVSDNLAAVSIAWKQRMIRSAVQQFGLRVLGEVGKKEGLESAVSLADDAKACLDAGAEIILLEAAEIVGDDQATACRIEEVVTAVSLERVMFELPGPWIAGVHLCDVRSLRNRLIARFGPEVNIGNVEPQDLMMLEAYRRGIGVNAGKPVPGLG